jgi:alginate O-acetyltransferase complex protein AlgI
MTFNSINFLLFFFTVTIIFYLIPDRFRWIWILLTSIFFYITFIPVFIFFLGGLIISNYIIGIYLFRAEKKRKKRIFFLSVLMNIFILSFFKYFHFFWHIDSFPFFNFTIFSVGKSLNQWVIPLGLSYFTFTVLSYLIEIKRGNIQPERHIGIFSAYLFFFPKIAQGPIERPQNLIPQFHQSHEFDFNNVVEGLKQMLWGFFKKLVIADRLAIYVNAVYNNSENHNGTALTIATFFFAFQIYADFSGYTDIAIGSARILGFKLTGNFNRPYFSTSIKEFWGRWHITFSTWLRDYLFLPLAYWFSKNLKNDKYLHISSEKWIYLFATMITFTVCGLWHGEGLNYLVWGLLFGIYLTYANWTHKFSKRIRDKLNIPKSSVLYKIYAIFITIILVSFTWIFFRSQNMATAISIIGKIYSEQGTLFIGAPSNFIFSIFGLSILVLKDFKDEFYPSKFLFFENKHKFIRIISYCSTIILIILIGVFDGGEFIYFQF